MKLSTANILVLYPIIKLLRAFFLIKIFKNVFLFYILIIILFVTNLKLCWPHKILRDFSSHQISLPSECTNPLGICTVWSLWQLFYFRALWKRVADSNAEPAVPSKWLESESWTAHAPSNFIKFPPLIKCLQFVQQCPTFHLPSH